MGESSGAKSLLALANESKQETTSISPPIFSDLAGSCVDQMEVSSIVESIEESKSHWSQVREFDFDNDMVDVSNVELFQTLQQHPTWGSFFRTEGEGSYGDLVMGKKFAEGGQAELYEVQIKWNSPSISEAVQKHKAEFALKVFKKGTSLRQLQAQWPQGMLRHYAKMVRRQEFGLPKPLRFHSHVFCATLIEDGRFAFVLVKEDKDLRSLIDEQMSIKPRPNNKGPFSKESVERIMYDIALGMNQLHGRGIVHRDIKSSNVLFSCGVWFYFVADFECLVGVVGTGFFRAPEILEACKHRNVNEKAKLFTKATDVYSYGMTCYEILTGKLPFEGHPENDYDLVLEGGRPKLPSDVDDWICELLQRCWQSNPIARPSFGEILKVLLANSTKCRARKLAIERQEVELGIRTNSKMAQLKRALRLVKLKMMYWLERTPSC